MFRFRILNCALVLLWKFPFVCNVFFKLRSKYRKLVVSSSTEIVIEGFPRTANTYAVLAFEYAQNRYVSIAHHIHAPSQISLGVFRGVPVIVLIRNPVEAISSLIVRDNVPFEDAVKLYVLFYREVLKFKDKIVVASFSDVISNFSSIISAVNVKYNMSYSLFDDSQDAKDMLKKEVDNCDRILKGRVDPLRVSRPSVERDAILEITRRKLRESKACEKYLHEANELYLKLAG